MHTAVPRVETRSSWRQPAVMVTVFCGGHLARVDDPPVGRQVFRTVRARHGGTGFL